MKEGIVYLPYIMVEHTDESLKEYKKFMTEYERKHKYCPKCDLELMAQKQETQVRGVECQTCT